MKKVLFFFTLLLALTCFMWGAKGQSVTIGSGTNSLDVLPSNSYYNYSISQQIYTTEEINASGSIMSNPDQVSAFTLISEQTGLINEYNEYTFDIPVTTTDRYVAIMIDAATSTRNYNGVCIDDISITASPAINQYEVTATVNPAGGGTVSGAGTYDHGAMATLIATANGGYTFSNWTEGSTVVSTDATYSFEVSGARTLTANFEIDSYDVTAYADPAVGGTVSGTWQEGQGDHQYNDGYYPYGTIIEFSATAYTGYTFTGWTLNGEPAGNQTSYMLTVTNESELVAHFAEETPTPTACVAISTFPWTENFENCTVETIPVCWDNTASTAQAEYQDYIWGVYGYGDNKMLRMQNYSVHTGNALIHSPTITLPTEGEYALTFDYAHNANCGAFKVNVSEDNGSSWVELGFYAQGTGSSVSDPGVFTKADPISLAAYAGKSIILQFFANANYGTGAIFVDNIVIGEALPCATTGIDERMACNNLTWRNGITYYESTNEPTDTIFGGNAAGCDSVITLHLTINDPTYGDDYDTICETELPYSWQGVTFTAAGNKPVTLTSMVTGCDSIVTLHLTIYHAVSTELKDTVCLNNDYNKYGFVIPMADIAEGENVFVDTLLTVHGCDSVVTLKLFAKKCDPTCGQPVKDADSISYPTAPMGNLCWMMSNLRTTHYTNGTEIPFAIVYTNPIDNSTVDVETFGRLYNWASASGTVTRAATGTSTTPLQGVCPDGWRLPTQAEFEALSLQYSEVQLRSVNNWVMNPGNNESGFNKQPGGFYNAEKGKCEGLGTSAHFYTADFQASGLIYQHSEYYCDTPFYDVTNNPSDGRSIRCVRNLVSE